MIKLHLDPKREILHSNTVQESEYGSLQAEEQFLQPEIGAAQIKRP